MMSGRTGLPAITQGPGDPGLLRSLLDEEVHELRRRVIHLDVEVLEASREIVVEPDGRDGHDQSQCRLDERFGDTGRHGTETGRTRAADTGERVDNADDRAQQTDERRGGADGGQGR